jgi:hypothetical protein
VRAHTIHLQAGFDEKSYDPMVAGLAVAATVDNDNVRPEGSHSTGYRFMPTSSVERSVSSAILCIAGMYPGLTAAQLQSPSPLPFASAGQWNYHMLTGDAAPGGFVALPGTEQLERCPDTVAVVCSAKSLGLEFPDGQEHEVLALIDRSDAATTDPSAFDSQSFYALADPTDAVHIRWIDPVPADWKVLGRLLYTQMPHVTRPGANKGFAETSDEFEF